MSKIILVLSIVALVFFGAMIYVSSRRAQMCIEEMEALSPIDVGEVTMPRAAWYEALDDIIDDLAHTPGVPDSLLQPAITHLQNEIEVLWHTPGFPEEYAVYHDFKTQHSDALFWVLRWCVFFLLAVIIFTFALAHVVSLRLEKKKEWKRTPVKYPLS